MREPNRHCVIRDNGETLLCEHCGESQTFDLPMELKTYAEAMQAFAQRHAHCPAPSA